MEILYPLTHPQKRVWYIEKMYPSTSVNNIGGFTRIKGDIDFDLLEKSINIYIQQNDAVRLRMVEREQEPLQYVTEFEYMTLDRMDFRTSEDPEQEFQNWIQKTVQKPFDLIEQPLFYIALYRINEQEGGYLLKYHHLIFDGWSASIMTKQVTTIYEALKHNQELPQVVSTNYLEYLDKEEAYLASPRCQKNKNYWLEKFKTLPDISNIKSTDDLKGNRKRFNLSSEQTLGVNNWIQEHKCSMNDFFSLIWLIYNYKHLQTDDLVIGFPLLNRSGVKEKQTIGMFTATMPFRIKIEKDMSIVELLKYLTSELKSCYTNYKYPYNLLAQDLGLRQQGYATLFTSCINYYNTQHTLSMDGCEVINEEFYNGCQTYSIQLIVKQWTSNGNINVDIDYKINDYDEKEIEELFRAITVVIEQVINKPDILVKNISLLSKKEEFELIYIFNQTEVEYPSDKNIIELFREQVKDKPDKVAIQHYGTYITYSELDQKSDRVAAYLNEVGIGKNQFVGIMATHSIELLVAIFGILKIGAAYVPINESLPSERIQYMVEDANIKYIMTNIQGQLGFIKNCQCIQIEDAYKENKNLVEILVEPESNAYVIYTSGSTGKPKGVLISQRSLVNYIVWAKKMYVTDENDAFALYSSISFDLTVTSIFTPLISGCKLVIYEENESEHALYRIMRERQVTVLKLTPAHLMLIKDLDNRLSTIRKLIVGGEELKTYIARQVYESFDSNVDICNEYGPTEATVGCMIYRFNVNENIEESVPIGIPAQNVQIYILDEQLKPVPKGMIGEMYISGDGLAKGYLNRPQLTQQCFIHNPFIEGRYMYKTGDLATFSMIITSYIKVEWTSR
ncbi:non-ribosomal peptide synthetase [Cellulosilyticum ruminicola]|uniref:non-ribosomal peptide synthetase n=1 Tax=Cellulosilyticum ruminicola TaxID=425254 RepID=UPI0006D10A2D|nr:amino acid adenylation domain-containing protein [Cellulosilyticum ruminicola]